MSLLFVGERRSKRAVKMGVTWNDGALAAKQLFDALAANGIDTQSCYFVNFYERGSLATIKNHGGPVIGMGRVVGRALAKAGISFVPMIHPAARGSIRRKDRYAKHVGECLRRALHVEE